MALLEDLLGKTRNLTAKPCTFVQVMFMLAWIVPNCGAASNCAIILDCGRMGFSGWVSEVQRFCQLPALGRLRILPHPALIVRNALSQDETTPMAVVI